MWIKPPVYLIHAGGTNDETQQIRIRIHPIHERLPARPPRRSARPETGLAHLVGASHQHARSRAGVAGRPAAAPALPLLLLRVAASIGSALPGPLEAGIRMDPAAFRAVAVIEADAALAEAAHQAAQYFGIQVGDADIGGA